MLLPTAGCDSPPAGLPFHGAGATSGLDAGTGGATSRLARRLPDPVGSAPTTDSPGSAVTRHAADVGPPPQRAHRAPRRDARRSYVAPYLQKGDTMIRNGLEVEKLTGLVYSIKNDPALATLRFTVHSEWKGGLRAQHAGGEYTVGVSTTRHRQSRSFMTDEPPEILGTDAGVSPAEMTLAALASCLMVGYSANATAMGIDLEQVTLDLAGDGDLQGFMNLGTVRPGLSRISVRARIKANATPEKLRELHDYVNAHSPIWDTLANPVRVESRLEEPREN
jgi:uncharacterized OsmC-like protein